MELEYELQVGMKLKYGGIKYGNSSSEKFDKGS